MANYLELVQEVARESGTVPGTQPPTVSGEQPARLQKMAYWVDQAWTMIQNHKANWLWMKAEFQATTTVGVARYSSIALGITRFSRFVIARNSMRIFDPTVGIDDEQWLNPVDFWYWKRLYGIRFQSPGRPGAYAVSAAEQTLCLGPVPDKAYTIIGEYFRSPQKLVQDTDIPELPERFHHLIAWKALMLLAGHDEGNFAVANASAQFREYLGELERDQLPTIRMGGQYWTC